MFGIDIIILAFVGLVVLGTVAVIYAVFYDQFQSEAQQKKRLKGFDQKYQEQASKAAQRITETAKRRKANQDSLKAYEEAFNAKHSKKLTIRRMMQQAGLNWTITQFILLSFVCAIIFGLLIFALTGNPLIAAVGLVVGAFGVPRWIISYLRGKRFKAFSEEFPNAMDVIVRGVKAGLPLNECLAIISQESKEPVRSEFSKMVDSQKMSLPLGQAAAKLYENVPTAETNFFGIVVEIQQGAGGNLSEALGNLSKVLRDRKRINGKIKAMSAEAKVSAIIIGVLPFLVAGAIAFTSPDYISILFTHTTGNIILGLSAIWMLIGIIIMSRMINFDY